jgi:hypothetical protein
VPPAGFVEVAFESAVPFVPLVMGMPYNVSYVTASGQVLAAGTWYGP